MYAFRVVFLRDYPNTNPTGSWFVWPTREPGVVAAVFDRWR